MDFNFTRAMMKSNKANPIKFKSNWSKELHLIQVQFGLGFQLAHQLVFGI